MHEVDLYETFISIQGESSYAGQPCFFVRLAGCNLRCAYCDTPCAQGTGEMRSVASILEEAAAARVTIVEVTGGEPLLQEGFGHLATALRDHSGKQVLVETNGAMDISAVPEGVVTVMDVKCPGSGEVDSFDSGNLGRLRSRDEVKFVISDRADYEWAGSFVTTHSLHRKCHAVHFSPIHPGLAGRDLANWIVEDGLPVRLQLQLHRVLNMR